MVLRPKAKGQWPKAAFIISFKLKNNRTHEPLENIIPLKSYLAYSKKEIIKV